MYFATFILKNIVRRRLRSMLTVLGVAIAVGAAVALLGIADGFERSFLSLYQQRGVELIVVRAGKAERSTSFLDERIAERLRRLPGVAQVMGGLVDAVEIPGSGLQAVLVQGWYADSPLFDALRFVSGRRFRPDESHVAVLGSVIARNLGKKEGDAVSLYGEDFQILGVFESFNHFENGCVVINIRDLQRLLGVGNKVTGFQVVVEPAPNKQALVDRLRGEIEALTDDRGHRLPLSALPTADAVSTTSQLRLIKAQSWITSVIAVVIGSIGVLNTMLMSVFERTREIGILRAIGWRRRRVVRMVLAESLLLSLAGAVVGILFGLALTFALSRVPMAAGYVEGTIAPSVLLGGLAIAVLVGLLGGVYPAWRAARLLPTEALRHE
ncbi:MAG: ABC transporter permease [Gemmataceae bacterium]|nr:ABC transporter permease [Gemmataceae bacterium]MDW8265360.1 ABC transporter permease [Gemmataceae bacterium]